VRWRGERERRDRGEIEESRRRDGEEEQDRRKIGGGYGYQGCKCV